MAVLSLPLLLGGVTAKTLGFVLNVSSDVAQMLVRTAVSPMRKALSHLKPSSWMFFGIQTALQLTLEMIELVLAPASALDYVGEGSIVTQDVADGISAMFHACDGRSQETLTVPTLTNGVGAGVVIGDGVKDAVVAEETLCFESSKISAAVTDDEATSESNAEADCLLPVKNSSTPITPLTSSSEEINIALKSTPTIANIDIITTTSSSQSTTFANSPLRTSTTTSLATSPNPLPIDLALPSQHQLVMESALGTTTTFDVKQPTKNDMIARAAEKNLPAKQSETSSPERKILCFHSCAESLAACPTCSGSPDAKILPGEALPTRGRKAKGIPDAASREQVNVSRQNRTAASKQKQSLRVDDAPRKRFAIGQSRMFASAVTDTVRDFVGVKGGQSVGLLDEGKSVFNRKGRIQQRYRTKEKELK
ncbi:hypothetical protein HDU97_003236 [Phlyctochytrium planicorne]|nr:hypothetical protein HDU97_003236 [Phlyctochytrium planicorne]